MHIAKAGQKLAPKRVPAGFEGGFIRIGPKTNHHMEIFAAKLGFALWFHTTGRIVPATGGVFARWYSNVDHWEGRFPDSLLSILGPEQTLQQGKKTVSDQFSYAEALTPGCRAGAFYSTFRISFAVANVIAEDGSWFDRFPNNGRFRIFQLGWIGAVASESQTSKDNP